MNQNREKLLQKANDLRAGIRSTVSAVFSSSRTIGVAILFLVWLLSHIFTINWGLPNFGSFATDAVPVTAEANAKQLMASDAFKYPPAQYLIWSLIAPPVADTSLPLTHFSRIEMRSLRLLKFRWITAVFAFGTACLLFIALQHTMKRMVPAVLGGALFLLNPLSLYYSHTTNMEHPYVFWFVLSCLAFYAGNMSRHQIRLRVTVLSNVIFGIAAALSFCTKDQVYALYILPFAVFMIVQLKRDPKLVGICLLSAGVAFLAALVAVYAAIGGWDTAANHFHWIISEGSQSYVQFDSTAMGFVQLQVSSLKNFFTAAEWLLTAGLAGLLIWALLFNRFSTLTKSLLLLTVLLFLSFQFFFVSVTRFTHPRYYLPFLPLLIALLILLLENLHRRSAISGRAVVLFLICMSSVLSIQLLLRLHYDSRIVLRQWVQQANREIGPFPLVALDAAEFGYRYDFTRGEQKRYRTIRNWAYANYGYILPQQQTVMLTQLSLELAHAPILVTTKTDQATHAFLRRNGYAHLTTIEPYHKFLYAWFWTFDPVFHIFTASLEKSVDTGESVDAQFADQLLTLQFLYGARERKAQLLCFGRLCNEFVRPDLDQYLLRPHTIWLCAISYMLNQRYNDAEQALLFLKSIVAPEEYRQFQKRFEAVKKMSSHRHPLPHIYR